MVSLSVSAPVAGGGECVGWSHPLHLQCHAGVSDLLADLQHHGRELVRREVLLLFQ